jgi:hypothetical protein
VESVEQILQVLPSDLDRAVPSGAVAGGGRARGGPPGSTLSLSSSHS